MRLVAGGRSVVAGLGLVAAAFVADAAGNTEVLGGGPGEAVAATASVARSRATPVAMPASRLPTVPAPERVVVVDRGAYDPAVSPDGSTVAFGLLGDIWLVSAQGGAATRLTAGREWDHHPTWSPDGSRLAYVHDSPTSSEIVLHTLSTAASRTVHGRAPAEAVGRGSWGPVFSFGHMAFHPTDGRLYFVDFRSGIWSLEPDDPGRPEPEQLLEGSGRLGRPGVTERSSFAFSPDGTRMVIEKDTTDLWSHLHVTPLDSVAFTPLAGADTVKRTHVRWRPDGSSVVYLELSAGRESLVVRNLEGTEATRRFELGPFNGRELDLFPGGDRALIVSDRRLFRVELSSGGLTPVPFSAELRLPARAPGDLVITNARLFDATGSDVIEGATVRIRDGRITAVTGESRRTERQGAADSSVTADSGVRVVDARGRFLMPGLVDAHGHVSPIGRFSQSRVPLRGVTTVFDLGSYLPETLNLRDAIRLGLLQGPHLYTVGPALDGAEGRARPLTLANVTDPADARALVAELHRAGVDAVKIYAFLEPHVVAAAIDEAHARGLPVVGDLVRTSWSEALEAGIDGFVHAMDHKWRFISEDQPDPADGPWAVVEPDSAPTRAFFAEVAQRGAMFDPTVMASSRHFRAADFAAALESAPGSGDGAPGDTIDRPRVLAELLRTMHRNGVQWVAGTDAGSSRLIEELEIYEIVGIPNADILRTATANPARWFGQDDFGTVEPGKRADLILVDGDPLTRIRDLEKVVLVVKEGRVLLEQ